MRVSPGDERHPNGPGAYWSLLTTAPCWHPRRKVHDRIVSNCPVSNDADRCFSVCSVALKRGSDVNPTCLERSSPVVTPHHHMDTLAHYDQTPNIKNRSRLQDKLCALLPRSFVECGWNTVRAYFPLPAQLS